MERERPCPRVNPDYIELRRSGPTGDLLLATPTDLSPEQAEMTGEWILAKGTEVTP